MIQQYQDWDQFFKTHTNLNKYTDQEFVLSQLDFVNTLLEETNNIIQIDFKCRQNNQINQNHPPLINIQSKTINKEYKDQTRQDKLKRYLNKKYKNKGPFIQYQKRVELAKLKPRNKGRFI